MRRLLVAAASVVACMTLLTGCMPLIGLALFGMNMPLQDDFEYVDTATSTAPPEEPALGSCASEDFGAREAIHSSDLWPGSVSETKGMTLTRYTRDGDCGVLVDARVLCEQPFPSVEGFWWPELMGTLRSTAMVSGVLARMREGSSDPELVLQYTMAYSDELDTSIDWFEEALACGSPRTIGGVQGTWFSARSEFVAIRPRGVAVLQMSGPWSTEHQEQYVPQAINLLDAYDAGE